MCDITIRKIANHQIALSRNFAIIDANIPISERHMLYSLVISPKTELQADVCVCFFMDSCAVGIEKHAFSYLSFCWFPKFHLAYVKDTHNYARNSDWIIIFTVLDPKFDIMIYFQPYVC